MEEPTTATIAPKKITFKKRKQTPVQPAVTQEDADITDLPNEFCFTTKDWESGFVVSLKPPAGFLDNPEFKSVDRPDIGAVLRQFEVDTKIGVGIGTDGALYSHEAAMCRAVKFDWVQPPTASKIFGLKGSKRRIYILTSTDPASDFLGEICTALKTSPRALAAFCGDEVRFEESHSGHAAWESFLNPKPENSFRVLFGWDGARMVKASEIVVPPVAWKAPIEYSWSVGDRVFHLATSMGVWYAKGLAKRLLPVTASEKYPMHKSIMRLALEKVPDSWRENGKLYTTDEKTGFLDGGAPVDEVVPGMFVRYSIMGDTQNCFWSFAGANKLSDVSNLLLKHGLGSIHAMFSETVLNSIVNPSVKTYTLNESNIVFMNLSTFETGTLQAYLAAR